MNFIFLLLATVWAGEPLVIEDAARMGETEAGKAIAEICAGRPALVVGGPLLSRRLVPWNDEKISLEEFRRRMNALPATFEALGATKGFRKGAWWPARGWETLPGGVNEIVNGELHLTTGGPLRQWDTWYVKVNPLAHGDDLIVVEARSDYDNAQMSLELGGFKGERSFATLELGRDWSRHVLDANSFVGTKIADLKAFKVKQIALGVSCQFTPKMSDRPSSVHVRFLGSRRNPMPGASLARIPYDRYPAVEGLWPAYKVYEREGLVSSVERPTGEGYGRGNVWRLRRGATPAEAILVERRRGKPERCLALFGYTKKEDLQNPAVLGRMAEAKRLLKDGAILFEAGTDQFAYLPGETATLGAGWRGEAKTLSLAVTDAQGRTVLERQVGDLKGKRSWSFRWALPERPAKYVVKVVLDGWDEISHEFALIDTTPAPRDDFVSVKGSDFILHGKKWYPVCVNFWPLYSSGTERDDYWNKWLKDGYYSPNVVRKDLDALVALGGNAVSIQPAWEGSERNMVDFFRLCRERDIRVNLFVPSADPFAFDETKLTNLLFRSRAALDPTVFAYDTSWEPGNHVFHAKRRNNHNRAWHDWVLSQFGSIEKAESVWGLSLGRDGKGVLQSPPDEAFRGGEEKWRKVMAAYRRFMDNMTSRLWNRTCRTVRRHAPNQLVSFRQGNTLPWDFALNGPVRHLDFVCPEGYSFENTDGHECAIGWLTRYVDAYSLGKPIIWSEFGRSVWDRSEGRPLPSSFAGVAQYSRRFYAAGLEAGANGFSPWWWPGGYRSDERSDYGIMNPDRTPRPAAETLAAFAAATRRERVRPTAGFWTTFDRDADAGGYCKATFGEGSRAYAEARAKGVSLGVKIAGTEFTSATCPAVALGDVPLADGLPPKYLDAEFDAFDWKRIAAENLHLRVEVGNPGPAAWKGGNGAGSVRLVVRAASTGRVLLERPLDADVPRFGKTGVIDLAVPLSGSRHLTVRLEAKGRFAFGEKREIVLPAANSTAGIRRTLLVHPDEFTDAWIDRAVSLGVDGLSFHPVGGANAAQSLEGLLKDLENPVFRARIDRARAKGLSVGYEMHAASWLLPRSLFDTHPEYFRCDKAGRRCRKTNFCFSNETALQIVARRAVELVGRLRGSSHRYFLWLDDINGGACACEKCRAFSESDQQLLYVNRVVTELRKTIPDATLGYLAYFGTVRPPQKVRPAPGVFLEYAPYQRDMTKAVATQFEKELKPLEALFAVFGRKDARVLEYWFDNSLFSKYKKPPKKLVPCPDIVYSDLACYRALGFSDMASFACYLGDDYERLWGAPDLSSFGRGFFSSAGGRDRTDFTWSIGGGRFQFRFDVEDVTPSAVSEVKNKRDLERGDRVEIFFSPTPDMSRWYHCAEIDPTGRVLDYRIVYPRRFDYGWSFKTLERQAVRTPGGYRVEGSVAVDELKELGVDPADFWLGAFRADYDGSGNLVAWHSLLPPGPGEPDFHRPCMLFHARSAERMISPPTDCKGFPSQEVLKLPLQD